MFRLFGLCILAATACCANEILIVKGADSSISVERALASARENYPLSKNKKLIDESLNLNLQKVNLTLIPRLKLGGKVSYQSDVTTLPLGTNKVFSNLSYKPLTKDQYQITLELSQSIFDANSMIAQRDILKAQNATAKASVENELYKVQQSVLNVYFAVLLLESQIKQSEILLLELDKNLKFMQNRLNNGVATSDDVAKIKIEILNTKRTRESLQNERRIQRSTLGNLTNLDLNSVALEVPSFAECKEFLSIMESKMKSSIKINNAESSVESSTKSTMESTTTPIVADSRFTINGFENRPEIHYFKMKQNEIDSQDSLNTARYLPYIDAFVQGGYGNPGLNILKSGFQPYYIAGIRLSWDISALYSKNIQNEILTKESLKLQSQREQFLLNARISLNRIVESAKNTLNEIGEYEKIIALQEAIVQNSRTKLANGVINVNDLISDMNKLHLLKLERNYQGIEFLSQVYNIKQAQNIWQ